ncbi:MAG TPA: MerC domain-containing protein [Polyangiaceae bacterium]|jgi:hypothetical protein
MPGESLAIAAHKPLQRVERQPWRRLDLVGISLSSLCVVHCLAMPLALLVLPFAIEDYFHSHLAPLVGLVALVAVGRGAWVHRQTRALPPLLAGLGLLAFVAVVEPGGVSEILLSIVASGFLIVAHWLNVRCSRPACACPADHLSGH